MMWRSVLTPGASGLMLRYRVEILVVSKCQNSLSPTKTSAIFSSSGKTRRVDWRMLAWIGTVLLIVILMVRASGVVGAGVGVAGSAAGKTTCPAVTSRMAKR